MRKMGLAGGWLAGRVSETSVGGDRRPFPRRRFRMAAGLAILTTIASFAMIRDEAPVVASGMVTAPDGTPVAGAKVELLNSGRIDAGAVTDAHGRWWLSGGHRIDRHSLRVLAPGFAVAERELSGPSGIVLHANPTIAGTVVDDGGMPVPGARVQLQRHHNPTRWVRLTSAAGHFDLTAESLTPGQFTISISALDHNPFQGLVHLQADQRKSLRAVLVRQQGAVTITSEPPGLTAKLDGTSLVGCTTPCSTAVVVGHHTISLDTPLYVPWTQAIDLHNREKLALSAVLERKQGTLTVSAPGGALVIDGTPVPSLQWTGRLPTGPHLVSNSSDSSWPLIRSVEVGWNHTTTLNLANVETAIVPGDQAAFLAGLTGYVQTVGGTYGVYLKDLKSGQEIGYGQDIVMEAASDIKVPLALFLLHQVEAGKVKLTDKVTLQDSDFMSGTGTLDGTAAAGDQYSLEELLTLMITISDNTAWQALMRVLTPDAIDAYAASLGAPDCHQVDDNCTPHELGLLFEGIYSEKLLQPAENHMLLDLLSNTIYNERIPYYLPGLRVAHKTGADGGVINDGGIVYLGGKPFIVSIFTLTADGQTGIQAIRDITRAYAHYLGPAPK